MIIAHNAKFDYGFMKAQSEFTKKDIIWACSMSQVPWKKLDMKTMGLELLCVLHGFYYKGHRALVDVDAIALLLSKSDYLKLLITESRKKIVRVKAKGADFDSKDLLKAQGYRWNAVEKNWWKDEAQSEIGDIKSWLEKDIYIKGSFSKCLFEELSLFTKFE